ncbi:MAG: aspartate aminotransferase family protein, partial [bacterium]
VAGSTFSGNSASYGGGIMNDMGLITLATAETVVRFLPPLTVSPAEIKQALQIIDKALAKFGGV